MHSTPLVGGHPTDMENDCNCYYGHFNTDSSDVRHDEIRALCTDVKVLQARQLAATAMDPTPERAIELYVSTTSLTSTIIELEVVSTSTLDRTILGSTAEATTELYENITFLASATTELDIESTSKVAATEESSKMDTTESHLETTLFKSTSPTCPPQICPCGPSTEDKFTFRITHQPKIFYERSPLKLSCKATGNWKYCRWERKRAGRKIGHCAIVKAKYNKYDKQWIFNRMDNTYHCDISLSDCKSCFQNFEIQLAHHLDNNTSCHLTKKSARLLKDDGIYTCKLLKCNKADMGGCDGTSETFSSTQGQSIKIKIESIATPIVGPVTNGELKICPPYTTTSAIVMVLNSFFLSLIMFL